MILTKNHTVLKNKSITYDDGTIDVFRLLLGLDDTFRVHMERRTLSGAYSEVYCFESKNLDEANKAYYARVGLQ